MGPLEYIHGYNMILAGLEHALDGKDVNDEFKLTLAPQDAYGEIFSDLVVETDRSQFPADAPIEVGMDFQAGDRAARIVKIDGDRITIDANHPLAGETLHFEVKVVSVKKTTEEELQALVQMMSEDSCGCGCGHDQEHSCSCGSCSGCH